MAKNLKIRNDDDKTIFELKLEDTDKNEKIKPGKVFSKIFIVILAVALSVVAGYILHKLTA